mmetsp:Transcript_23450/g.61414  ORF Transcript_23450/g.61414 Transcript_23450/m.61414 type:complete len:310 (+) Transcript_23450:250-1179(+)|eukprot:CAMPEP_0182929494 /NCGR_PEP_ID=MMETSP0105_2-20130417/21476_1 /TAXON_ID=81532 ORGANISM="Acanthoeca-like sp., Strain 10tr" /NCGR_SAMPLE_ID=MMETSP0105_2 /ASSEMBLY_ACC=CAM_ASM_000205 /LENGTH=309 /DNA_ID=CAMNT_0025067649 /DNA_START=162 /DNA_END=1091 /DNA_ORIENTATION=-
MNGTAATAENMSAMSKVKAQLTKAQVMWDKHRLTDKSLVLARVLICTYFFNQAYTGLEIWYFYRQPFPMLYVWLMPLSLAVVADMGTVPCAAVMAAIAGYDVLHIFANQLTVWWVHGSLYINELMVKKLSLLGAIGLILAHRYQADASKRSSQVAGLLITKAEEVMSDRKSLVMLVGRLLMSSLFLYVGVTEVIRQYNSVIYDSEGHQHRRRAAGDGHDNMWSKLSEFVLSIPFVLGYKSKGTAILLAIVLVMEAMFSWLWFLSNLNIGYRIHAREHFTVNVGVAGALMMFAYIGAGKYSVDNYLKKTE